jgi:hypothetical protein
MSGKGKGKGVAHKILDDMAKFEVRWTAKQEEIVAKHNDLVTHMAGLEAAIKSIGSAAGTEIAKLVTGQELRDREFGGALSGLDLNILAMAEIVKEIFGQLSQIDTLFDRIFSKADLGASLSEDDRTGIKAKAEEWLKQVTISAFSTVQNRFAAEAKARQEAEQAAKEEAEKAASAKQEAERVEKELQQAEATDRSLVGTTTGGAGTSFPEGADIWGG